MNTPYSGILPTSSNQTQSLKNTSPIEIEPDTMTALAAVHMPSSEPHCMYRPWRGEKQLPSITTTRTRSTPPPPFHCLAIFIYPAYRTTQSLILFLPRSSLSRIRFLSYGWGGTQKPSPIPPTPGVLIRITIHPTHPPLMIRKTIPRDQVLISSYELSERRTTL